MSEHHSGKVSDQLSPWNMALQSGTLAGKHRGGRAAARTAEQSLQELEPQLLQADTDSKA